MRIPEPVERERNDQDDGAGQHGQPSDTRGIKRARIDGLCRPDEKRERVEGEKQSRVVDVVWRESSAAKDQPNNRLSERDHDGSRQKPERDYA